MDRYPTDFLKREWDGAGFDYEVCCHYDQSRVDANSLSKFIAKAQGLSPIWQLGISQQPVSPVWIWLEEDAVRSKIHAGERFFEKAPGEIEIRFKDKIDDSLWFYALYGSPDEICFGAPSEYFYSGSLREDRRRVEEIVEIIFLARDCFGDAIGYFAPEGFARDLVDKHEGRNDPPNITNETDKAWWVDHMWGKVENSRPVE